MTRLELAVALGAALLVAAALGWALGALRAQIRRRGGAEARALADLSRRLADAEEARDALAAETAAREAGLIAAAQETETELRRDLTQRTAELDAAMDTIGALRREIEALRGAA
ncbi:hypothetical protein SAMN05444336_103403 [Albimonas donghaensis]|uniref:Uncharacterized protein n=1 Tax=Albimonas donghaensis TaxID=356660 RepID=A0A1H2Z895_9RHOB|nr:hypothetical protein [Albimonas donghaensis]SDX13547.1 hypothetical protein SAMN05444336_103403 [Albimonas donghaensis]